jgi:hypothetical protein
MRRSPSAAGPALALSLVLAAGALRPAAAQAPAAPAPATPVTASADVAAVRAIEHAIWDAVARNDWDTANGYLEGALVMNGGRVMRWTKAVSEARRAMNCTVRHHTIDDMQTQPVGADVVLVTYRITLDMTCPGQAARPPLYYMSVFHREPAGWKLRATAVSPVPPPTGGG